MVVEAGLHFPDLGYASVVGHMLADLGISNKLMYGSVH